MTNPRGARWERSIAEDLLIDLIDALHDELRLEVTNNPHVWAQIRVVCASLGIYQKDPWFGLTA